MSDRTPQTGDEELLAALGAALDATEPVPSDAAAVAVGAFDFGRLDAELADLVFDSLVEEPAVALRHAGLEEVRSLGFIAAGLRVDVELVDEDESLLGQLEPAAAAEVELETGRGGTTTTRTDDLGRFRFEAARGSLRLRVTTDDGVVVTTPWITW